MCKINIKQMFSEPMLSFKTVIQLYKNNGSMLPVSTAKDKVRCLDFDMDKVVFASAPRSPVKLAEVNPYNKTWLEVLDMV